MIFLVTGPVHGGKTTFLRERLAQIKRPVWGFLSLLNPGLGYDLYDVADGSLQPFIRLKARGDCQKTGRYYVLPQGLKKAENLILEKPASHLLIVDEVGPLELRNKGLWPALKKTLFLLETNCVLVVRDSKCDDLQSKLKPLEVKRFDIFDAHAGDQLIRNIMERQS